jgi:phenylalanyl-tRNA synthetase beta chain
MSDDDVEKLNLNKDILVKTIENREASWLRNTMLPEMMRKVHFNLKNFKDFTLFEIGRVFEKNKENKRLSIVMTKKENLFEEMKIIVETIAKELKIPMFFIERIKQNEIMLANTILHPFRGAVFKTLNKKSAVFGEIHPDILKKYNIKTKVAYAEFDLDLLFSLPQKGTKYKPIPKYPSTFFEFTLVVEEKKEVKDIFAIISKSVKKQLLVDYSVIAKYKGEPIPQGFQSLSFRVVLNAGDRTLTNEEMKAVQDKLIDDLRKKGLKLKGD